jgi:hypothetical protein
VAAYFAKPPLGARLNPADPLARWLAAAWLLNEGSGPTIYEAGGRKANGALTNGPAWVGGPFGKCLSFDAADDYVALSGVPSYASTHSHGYAAWVNTPLTGSYQWVLTTGDDTHGTALAVTTGGLLAFWYLGANFVAVSAGAVPANTLTHIAAFWDATDTKVRFYINGQLDTTSSAIATTWSAATTGTGRVGMYHAGTSFPFSGRLDAPMIFGGLPSGADLRALAADPFRPFRRRRVPVPLSVATAASGGGRDLVPQGCLMGANLLGNGTLVAA